MRARGPFESSGKLLVSLRVKNAGTRAADEVVQLYVRAIGAKAPRARKDLRGIARVPLAAGESRQVDFVIDPAKDLRRYGSAAKDYVVDAGRYEVQVGASSADIRQHATFAVSD